MIQLQTSLPTTTSQVSSINDQQFLLLTGSQMHRISSRSTTTVARGAIPVRRQSVSFRSVADLVPIISGVATSFSSGLRGVIIGAHYNGLCGWTTCFVLANSEYF